MPFGWYADEMILSSVFDREAYRLQYIELALSRADPGKSGLFLDEPFGNGYSRPLVSFLSWDDAVAGLLSNILPIVFDEATGPWGEITHWVLWGEDEYFENEMIAYGELDTPADILVGHIPRFATGQLRIEFNGANPWGGFSNYLDDFMLDYVFQRRDYNTALFYVALCDGDPGKAGTGADCSEFADDGGYARVETYWGTWYSPGSGEIVNLVAITFPVATLDWGLATHFAILDSEARGTGNMLVYGELTAPVLVTDGSIVRFDAGLLQVTLE